MFPVPGGPKPNPSLAGLSFVHPPGWFEFEREILEWWSAARDSLLLFSIPTNYNDSPLLHFEKEVLTWWHGARESILGLSSVAGGALDVWRNDVLHYQYEGELAVWWEEYRIDLLYTDFSFVCDQNSITPSITLSAGAPTPLWTVAESGVGAEYGYTTASFTHNRTVSGPMTVTLRDSWQIRPYVTAVQCDSDGITSELADMNVQQFVNLTSLRLESNSIAGSIPAEIGEMVALTDLRLHNNQLSGSIPSTVGNLTALTNLRLEGNQLSGSIPSTIGNLTALVALRLHENQLSGGIPSTIGNLTLLTALILSENGLTGSVPAEIGNLTALTELFLFDNQLTGALPAELGNLGSLQVLRAHINALSGVESGALDLPALETLLLQNNGMSEAEVDGVIGEIYAFRASYTGSPEARVDGSNAAPSGIYQAACPPGTGKEQIFELESDSCGSGHNLWSIMYTA